MTIHSSVLTLPQLNLLSSAIDQQSLKSTLTDLDALDKTTLLSCGMPHANAWIRALPVGTNMLPAWNGNFV